MKRRTFLASGLASGAVPLLKPLSALAKAAGEEVNDVHAQLNKTIVDEILSPATTEELQAIIARAKKEKKKISICGSRHAMGGQQFGTRTLLVDMRGMDKVISLDADRRIVEVEAGIIWPKLMKYLNDAAPHLAVAQKQTGADELSLGGALASNIHGRCLVKPPLISDVESFTIVMADGRRLNCSRTENEFLFSLVIGGYGLFGIVDTVRLRLAKRIKLRRVVEVTTTGKLVDAVEQRVGEGYLYGDFQYMTDEKSDGFMREGIFTCYLPVKDDVDVSPRSHDLSLEAWKNLYRLAYRDKKKAFEMYRDHYLETDKQVYWSDQHQTGLYLKDFNKDLAAEMGVTDGSSLMLSEVYVPRRKFRALMERARKTILARKMNNIYGTVRFIRRDEESFMPWAREDFVCVIFNLDVVHNPASIEKAKEDFQALYDIALKLGGSYYLTYHRWARQDQVEAAYPRLKELLALKRNFDPSELFQSDWYRHYKKMLG